jgi:hypothetical protein
MMKKIKLTLVFFLVATVMVAQKSPRQQVTGKIGETTIDIDYSAPSVKGRTIWGGLEKYGVVWRAGADANTTFSFDKDVKIGGTTVPAGKYGFFIIPNEDDDWVIILNKKNDGWGAYSYNQEDDVLRMIINPKFVKDNLEMLSYVVVENGVEFGWEKARVFIPIK